MRHLLAVAICAAPFMAGADVFRAESTISKVTVYPSTAQITRSAVVSLPAGSHDLIFADLPRGTDPGSVRVSVAGAQLGAVAIRDRARPPAPDRTRPDVLAAQTRIENIEAQIETVRDDADRLRLTVAAAEARLAFLNGLNGNGEETERSVDTLRALSRMIGEESLDANEQSFEAQIDAREAERVLDDLNEDLEEARQALAALTPETTDRLYLELAVSTAAASKAEVTITYVSRNAAWNPVYDIYLTQDENASVDVVRGAQVFQGSGENWTDVALTLSTLKPSGQLAPGTLFPQLRQIVDPEAEQADLRSRLRLGGVAESDMMLTLEDPLADAPVSPAPKVAQTITTGYAVVYVYASPVSVASGADNVRLKLDTLSLPAQIEARAVPIHNNTAFLAADMTNNTGETLLASADAARFVDGAFVGRGSLPEIPEGETADLFFGPIEGLRLERVILDQTEGDRGLLSRTNEQMLNTKIALRNLTDQTWPVRLLDQVPFTQQEDLEISWSATPAPSEENVEDQRGILGWDLEMTPGQEQVITLQTVLKWPNGMLLR